MQPLLETAKHIVDQAQHVHINFNALKKTCATFTLAMDPDSWLWLQTQTRTPNDKPYHRTRTTTY